MAKKQSKVTAVITANMYEITLEVNGKKIIRTTKRINVGSMKDTRKGRLSGDIKKIFPYDEYNQKVLTEALEDLDCFEVSNALQELDGHGHEAEAEESEEGD